VPLPEDALSPSSRGSSFAISPDGNQLALRAVGHDGRDYLWVRPIASSNALLLPGTAGTQNFFWAPDSLHLASFPRANSTRSIFTADQPSTCAM
jgi:hypothetical protein